MVNKSIVWKTKLVVILLLITSIIDVSMWSGMAFSITGTIVRKSLTTTSTRYPVFLGKNMIRTFASKQQPDWDVARDIVEISVGKNNKMCCAIAGGGSSAISTLAGTQGASQLFLEGIITYDTNSLTRYLSTCKAPLPPKNDHSYVSIETSQALSMSAWHSSNALSSSSSNWGLACTSALSTHSNKKERSHGLGYISITNPQLDCTTYQIKVSNSIPRHSQDVIVGNTLLSLFYSQLSNTTTTTSDDDDDVQVKCIDTTNFQSTFLQEGLQQVMKSQRSFLYLTYSSGKWLPTSLPQSQHPILVPGSFNPIHSGHVQLAQAAAAATTTTEDHKIIFEISMTNADKPPISVEDVLSRLYYIQQLCGENVGVVISDAPYFVQKVQLFHTHFNGKLNSTITFVIGTDTMVRLLDPKYYHNSQEEMIASLEQFLSKHVQFIVGGRLDQKSNEKKFITGQDEVSTLPSHLQSLFQLLPNFRVDMSSTEIRSKQPQENE